MRTRIESFGAWIAIDDQTLVAVDRTRARSLGIDGGAAWRDDHARLPRPLEVHVAVTARCPVQCSGCYQNAGPHGENVPRAQLDGVLDSLARAGVFTVAFGGGEPLARDDLGELAVAARAHGLTPVVTTSGLGLTPERARSLRSFAQVNVSHDGTDGAYRAVRGFEASAHAEHAIALLVDEGIAVGVNLVLTRESFAHVEATARRVRTLGARELQLLRYKPSGRAASVSYLAQRLAPSQSDALAALLERLVSEHGESLAVRIDCALVPFLSGWARDARALEKWGVFGCEAGRHLAAVTRDGSIAPCSFDHAGDASANDFDAGWESSTALAAYRAFVRAPPEPCRSCPIRSACRGGCKVVATHLGAFGADPECPRVRAHAAGES
jgi:radical SAM protein with 4Fe4S-binding SPASM domain